jgi:protein gp37
MRDIIIKSHTFFNQMNETIISWTQFTWNCLRGCSIASPGCKNCYAKRIAATFANRLKAQNPQSKNPFAEFAILVDGEARWTGKVAALPDKLLDPMKLKEPSLVFTASMSDMFHEDVPWAFLDQMFAVMYLCPQHTFQNLTKRHKEAYEYCSDPETPVRVAAAAEQLVGNERDRLAHSRGARARQQSLLMEEPVAAVPWPLPNSWLGFSVENDVWAKRRIPWLKKTPAAVRWLSIEPLIGELSDEALELLAGLDWAVVGGESGLNYREMQMAWARRIKNKAVQLDLAFFYKQDSAPNTEMRKYLVEEDGSCWLWNQYPGQMNPPQRVEPDNWRTHLKLYPHAQRVGVDSSAH